MMSKTESYIEAVAEFLARPRKALTAYTETDPEYQFRLEGHMFIIEEYEFPITLSGARLGRLSVVYPPERLVEAVVYDPESVPKFEACRKLATKFVRNMLPEVDYRFKAELHNDEIEEVLAVLV